VQDALLADGTAFDVDAGDAKQEVADGLRPLSRRRRLSQEHVALRQSGRPAAVGEQPEVADADEAVGDHVGQEAAQKLVDVEIHDLHTGPVSVVAPAEMDAAIAGVDKPVIGNRHAVGVAAEISEECSGPAKGGLQ
jgi:hypothetical protein